MKRKILLLAALMLFVFSSCGIGVGYPNVPSSVEQREDLGTQEEMQASMDLYSIAGYYGWPEDVFTSTYFPVDGSDIQYSFITRPDGKVALQGMNPAASSKRPQYPLRDTELYLREDGIAFLHFEEDYGASFSPDGVLTFGGREYWPRWLTENDRASRSRLNDILGGTVKVAFVDQGYYRVGDGSYANDDFLYFIPNNGSPILVSDANVNDGFCVYEEWFYMDEGKTDINGNFIPYEENGLFQWKNMYLIGMNRNHLYFVEAHEDRIHETDLNGTNARCIFDMGQNGVDIRFVTMNENTLCCCYERKISSSEKEKSFVLIDLASGNQQYITNVPYRTYGDWSETWYIYADWAGIFDDCVLFYTNETDGYVKKMDLNSLQYTNIIEEYELPVYEGSYVYTPDCARVGEWIYHPYSNDRTMLVRSRLDGSVVCEYVATMEKEIQKVYFVDGRLILRLEEVMMSNSYVEIGY